MKSLTVFLIYLVCFFEILDAQEVILPLGHNDYICNLKFSDDGKYLLSSSNDNTIKLWDLKSGMILRTFIRPISDKKEIVDVQKFYIEQESMNDFDISGAYKQLYLAVYFESAKTLVADISSDNETIVCGYHDGQIVFFNILTSQVIHSFKAHKGRINDICISQDGKYVFSASQDGRIGQWNIKDGSLIRYYEGHYAEVHSLDLTTNEKYMVSCGGDFSINSKTQYISSSTNLNMKSKVIVWDMKSGKAKYQLEDLESVPTNVVFGNNFNELLVGDIDGVVSFWKGKNQSYSLKNVHSLSPITSICLKEGSTEFISVSLAKVYQHPNYHVDFPITKLQRLDDKNLLAATIDKQGKLIAFGDDDGKIYLLDANKMEIINVLEKQTSGKVLDIISFEKSKGFYELSNDRINFWDLSKGNKRNIEYHAKADKFDYNPQLNYMLTSSDDSVKIWELTGNHFRLLKAEKANDALFIPNSNLYLTKSDSMIKHTGIKIDQFGKWEEWEMPDEKIYLKSINSEGQKFIFNGHEKPFVSMCIDKSAQFFITGGIDKTIKLWSLNPNKKHEKATYISHIGEVSSLTINPVSSGFTSADYQGNILLWDTSNYYSPMFQTKGHIGSVNDIKYSENGEFIFSASDDMSIKKWKATSLEAIYTFPSHTNKVNSIDFFHAENMLSCSDDNTVILWNFQSGSEIARFIGINEKDWLIINPDGYYYSSKGAVGKIGFRKNMKVFPFEQFDLKYNRPDIVLSGLGYADSTLIEAYHKAYLKRLKKMGFKEEDLGDDFHMPESKIKNFEYLPTIIEEDNIELDLNFKDSKYKLDRVNVWINNVAVYGVDGIDLREENTRNSDKKIKLLLARGENKIQVSCLNQKGVESYKETVYITYETEERKPNLYIVSLGVSEYKNTAFNLTYAAKDAHDFVAAFSENKQYNEVFVKTLTNEEVVKDNLAELRKFLEQAGRDDVVMLFIAGHGLLDAELDYYFASYDMDFNNPSARGIPYEEIEALLDGLQALKKILFMDTCHSGEVDKDETEYSKEDKNDKSEKDIVFRNVGGYVVIKKNIGLTNSSELVKELFTDLRKGTGATVISSAGGGEYAMESDKWKNGLFTYCLLNGLTTKAADLNQDGEIMLSEIQQYVQNQVSELSRGMQKPTSRIENIEMDFRVW